MGKQKLIDHISQFADFTEEENSLIRDNVYVKEYAPNEIFLEKGKKETEIAFILSGVFRFFFYDGEGNEIISSFLQENQIATILSDYSGVEVSEVYIQSVTASRTVNVNRPAWNLFCQKIASWNIAMQKMGSQYFIEKTKHQRVIIKMNAEESYIYFAKKFPGILSRVPLSYVANYLGITPYSLSRIRKRITKKNS